ncbi:hypothetical protein [Microbulbifer sp. TYP-18]|uniref:hypothetical protein n=1 Tax=Microbulbifer sp. TYP-18 TaxID=3230024 RepID=UPI0034C62278
MINSFGKYFASFLLAFASFSVGATEHYLRGTMDYLASTKTGLVVRLDTGVPDNCAGATVMRIRKEDSVIISVTLASWASGKREVDVYTEALAAGVCYIYQLDPRP